MQIKFNDVSFSYQLKSEFRVDALKHINLDLSENNVTAIVGKTGSGKSTLIQMINNLLEPTEGEVIVNDFINKRKAHHSHKDILSLRKDIGFLFQFSENQLFEETVIKDVSFAVKNFYPKEKNHIELAENALSMVGLGADFYKRSPLDLSGGEKKRVAIAGVIAYKPKVLILDEPTAGLDAKGKKDIMDLFMKIHKQGTAIILVTHDMDVVLNYADKMIVIDDGEIKKVGSPKDILKEDVEQYNLETPHIYKAVHYLKNKGVDIDEEKVNDIASLIKELTKNG